MFKRLLFALFGIGAAGSSALPGENVARVSALASGQLLLDGQPVALHALDRALADLKAKNGVVWFYRENPGHETPPQATDAIGLVVKHQLPISMATKGDFSDVVDASGQPRPREP